MPLSKGGFTEIDNLQLLTRWENATKGNKIGFEFNELEEDYEEEAIINLVHNQEYDKALGMIDLLLKKNPKSVLALNMSGDIGFVWKVRPIAKNIPRKQVFDRALISRMKIRNTNITDLVEAIVNSSNPFISRGGGVCGAIHKAAGFAFTEYCVTLGGLEKMQCKITPGFDLPYKYVIHTLAPMYKKSKNPKSELTSTYLNVVRLAKENDIKSIAFPILGSGNYGYPLDMAIDCAFEAFNQVEDCGIKIKLVCYTEEEYDLAKELNLK